MSSEFERRMAEAARLMSAGRIAEATVAMQQAFAGAVAPPADAAIEVPARVVAEPSRTVESFTAGHYRDRHGARDYKLFEPARDGRPLPLVVMLHGCGQDPDDFARGTAMNALARRQGALVLYPAQAQGANPQRCWNWFRREHQARGQGEPAILAGLVRDVMARREVDADRVYVAGLSAGGAMAAILGDAYPDLFAAVGVHSGLPAGAAFDVQGALRAMGGAPLPPRAARPGPLPPTIVFHGDADPTVNVVNAARVLAGGGLREWREARQEAGANGRSFTRRVLVDERGAERAEQWTVHGGGHAWSGGDGAGSYADPYGPDASAEMLRFFLDHPRHA